MKHVLVVAFVLSSACADAHPPGDSRDAASPDTRSPDARSPCPPPFVDEGDACLAWQAIPAPPCSPARLSRSTDELRIVCDDGSEHALTDVRTWDPRDGAGEVVAEEIDAPPDLLASPRMVVTLGPGRRVATHGDVYAHPAAWRTDDTGRWRETIPPPSAFLTHAAAISEHEALFVGTDAFVFTWR